MPLTLSAISALCVIGPIRTDRLDQNVKVKIAERTENV